MANKQYYHFDLYGLYLKRTIRRFRRVRHIDQDFYGIISQASPQAVVRFFRTTAPDQKNSTATAIKAETKCRQTLPLQHGYAKQKYERFSQRRREHKEALGKAESIRALEDATKQIKKSGDTE